VLLGLRGTPGAGVLVTSRDGEDYQLLSWVGDQIRVLSPTAGSVMIDDLADWNSAKLKWKTRGLKGKPWELIHKGG
jgi:hypothetical protein